MAKRKPAKPPATPPAPPTKPTPPAKPTPAPPPRRSKAGRPRITPPGAGPVRRLVVSDLGPYAARCLAEIKAAMAAHEGGVVTDADVVRFALWFTFDAVSDQPADVDRFLSFYREASKGGPLR